MINRKRTKKAVLFVLGVSLLCTFGVKTNANAEEIRLPSGFTVKELDDEIEQFVEENKDTTAAVAVAVIHKGDTVYERNFGYQDVENQIEADKGTVYEWGSLSKVLTWTSVMQLSEQGKLNLNEDINKYLPDGFLKKLSYDTPITMLDLMNHTGGWQDSITNVYTDEADDILPLEEYLSKYEPAQIYEPGTTVAYSNWGVTLAGYIVERVSGKTYIDYVNQNIFTPLGMIHTSIDPLRGDNTFVRDNLAETKGYTTKLDLIKGQFYAPDYPAAGASGTLEDVELLCKALLCKTNNPLFREDHTLDVMLTTSKFFLNTEYPENSHGLWCDFYQTPSMGHYGNTPRSSTHMSISKETDTGMIVLTNQAQEMKYNVGIGDFIFGKKDNDMTKDSNWKQLNFKEYYVSARTIKKGYCHFYNYFQIYKVKKENEDQITIYSPFLKLPCTRIAESAYKVDDKTLKGYQVFVDADQDGMVNKMATMTFDFIEYPN